MPKPKLHRCRTRCSHCFKRNGIQQLGGSLPCLVRRQRLDLKGRAKQPMHQAAAREDSYIFEAKPIERVMILRITGRLGHHPTLFGKPLRYISLDDLPDYYIRSICFGPICIAVCNASANPRPSDTELSIPCSASFLIAVEPTSGTHVERSATSWFFCVYATPTWNCVGRVILPKALNSLFRRCSGFR
jgi:hypothetical protein